MVDKKRKVNNKQSRSAGYAKGEARQPIARIEAAAASALKVEQRQFGVGQVA